MPDNFRNYTLLEVRALLADFLTEAFAPEDRALAMEMLISAMRGVVSNANVHDPRLYTLEEFLEVAGNMPPPIARALLPTKNLLCLSGSPKQGKSLVILEFLYAVSCGEALFGMHDVDTPGSVLYFAFEDGFLQVSDRLRRRSQTKGDNYFLCVEPFDMNTETGFNIFCNKVKSLPEPPRLVAIDTARHAFSSIRDWNDASEVGRATRPLLMWAHDNCSVLMVAHNNKDKFATGVNRISGSTALTSTSDGYMLLENQKVLENGDLVWDFEVSARSLPRRACQLRMDTTTLRVHEVDEKEGEEIRRQSRKDNRSASRLRIYELAQEMGTFTIREMAQAIHFSEDYTRDLVRELVDMGQLERSQSVREDGTKRPVHTYRCAGPGSERNGAGAETGVHSSASTV